jgi:superfamily II DNA or RNA helicase
LNGSHSADERKEFVDKFRASDDCLLFVVSIKAGGCGLNLQVAHVVVILDQDYTGTNEDQAVARVFRIGQRNTVRAIYLLSADASERRVAQIASQKDKPRHAIIEGGAYRTSTVNDDERQSALRHALEASSKCEVIDLATTPLSDVDPRVFDCLIASETDEAHHTGVLEKLEANTTETFASSGAFDVSSTPSVLLSAIRELEKEEEEECGRGKRARDDVNVTYPSEAFFDKYTELGWDDNDIIALYRKMNAEREARKRELEELLGQQRADVHDLVGGPSRGVAVNLSMKKGRRMPCSV